MVHPINSIQCNDIVFSKESIKLLFIYCYFYVHATQDSIEVTSQMVSKLRPNLMSPPSMHMSKSALVQNFKNAVNNDELACLTLLLLTYINQNL